MDFVADNIYQKALLENEKNLGFWEDYLHRLKSLDFNEFNKNLRVPALIPVGSRIMFRGEIKHTNEVTVALGADYFVKCSIAQAEILRQHRIKDAQSKADAFRNERKYLENQLSFSKRNVFEEEGQEIIESYNEHDDNIWRQKHKENMRRYKKSKSKDSSPKAIVNDDELWERLEELELQEELAHELEKMNQEDTKDSMMIGKPVISVDTFEGTNLTLQNKSYMSNANKLENERDSLDDINKVPKRASNLDLLQQVLEKQHELEKQLQEFKCKEIKECKTENDLLSKLDEIEQLDELEDEMNRIEDLIENVNSEDDNDEDLSSTSKPTINRSVTFADEDDSDTLKIEFSHSNVSPCIEPYNKEKGIQKPSDIYEANLHYSTETTSILKKYKYNSNDHKDEVQIKTVTKSQGENIEDLPGASRTVIVKDVTEKVDQNHNKIHDMARPTSIFKMRRQQMKS